MKGTARFHTVCCSALAMSVVAGAFAAAAFAAPQRERLAPGIRMLVDRIEERYEEAADLRARFIQRRLSRLGSVMTEVSGEVFMSPPGRMRWEYENDSQLLVAEGSGRETYLFFPEDNQVQVMQSDLSTTSELPLLYLAGRGSLRRDFNITVVEWSVPLADRNVQLELRPRRGDGSFERLIMEVDPMQATIARLITFDHLRNTIEYQFHDLAFDVGLADGLFEFDIPDGADVIFIGG